MKPIPTALAAPWAIEPQWLRVVFGVWSRGQIDAPALAQARADWEARAASRPRVDEPEAIAGTGGTLRIIGDVGVIAIEGPLFRHASLFSDISGGTSYDAIWRGLEAALARPQVRKILLRVNSPGGEADGVSELAKGIRAAGEKKQLWAYVDGLCASAAYWLASQASHIVAEETGEIGSIGVRCGIIDDSAADQMAGIREIEIISSQSPGKRSKPVDDAVIGRVQTRIDDLADRFVAAVALGRGVSPELVLEEFGQGGVMISAKALAAGMIDELGNFDGTIAALGAAATDEPRARQVKGTQVMPKATDRPLADDDAGAGEWQCAGCNEMMGKSARAYCAKCADGDDADAEPDGDEEEAKALGLPPKASGAERRERMVALAAFESEVFGLVGAKTAGEARGSITAGAAAVAELHQVRAAAAKAAQSKLQQDYRAALNDPRLTLGQLTSMVPIWLPDTKGPEGAPSEREKATKALEKLTTQTREGIVEALCTATAAPQTLESILAFAKLQPAAVLTPPPHTEPAPTQAGVAPVLQISAAQAKEMAVGTGLRPETIEKFYNVNSVAEIHAAAKKKEQ